MLLIHLNTIILATNCLEYFKYQYKPFTSEGLCWLLFVNDNEIVYFKMIDEKS